MASFNKVILMGNLTRDPQLQVPAEPDGRRRVRRSPCNRKFSTAAGEDREEVTFVDCTAFGKHGRGHQPVLHQGQADLHRGPAQVRHLGRQAGRRQAQQAHRRRRELPVRRRPRRRRRRRRWRRRRRRRAGGGGGGDDQQRPARRRQPRPRRRSAGARAAPARSRSRRSARSSSSRKTTFRSRSCHGRLSAHVRLASLTTDE